MKKMLLSLVILLVVPVFLAYAEEQFKDMSIMENLLLLKGKWEGDRSATLARGGTATEYRKTEVEITNGTIPLEGAIILHFKLGEPERLEFKNGILKNGKIFIQLREDVRQWWTFSLYSKGEKMELRGEYQIVKTAGGPINVLGGNFILRKK